MNISKTTVSEILRRYLLLTLGLLVISFGVAFLIKASVGVSPISAFPYTISLIFPQLTVGTWIAIYNLLLVVAQPIIRPRKVMKLQLILQLFMTFFFGYFTDLALECLIYFQPEAYVAKLVSLVCGCVIIAFGSYLCVICNVGMLPMDSFLQVLAEVLNKQYANIRIMSDVVWTVLSGILCLTVVGELIGVREGTLIAAFITGAIIKAFLKYLRGFSYVLLPENMKHVNKAVAERTQVSENHFVLTVSHEYGSGGRTIAKRIAHELDLPYYDTEIIQMSAEKSGFAESYLEQHEEKISSNALYKLADWYTASYSNEKMLIPEQIFRVEAQVIQEIAAKDSCVIVGRLANYVLQNHKNSLHIFITADEIERIKRVMRKDGITHEEAQEKIRSYAIERRNHCQQFSDMEWGNGANYDITIKSNRYGVDRTAAIILEMIKEFRLMQF